MKEPNKPYLSKSNGQIESWIMGVILCVIGLSFAYLSIKNPQHFGVFVSFYGKNQISKFFVVGAVALLILSILIIPKISRQLGWFIAGQALIISLIGSTMLYTFLPDGHVGEISTLWIEIIVIIICIACGTLVVMSGYKSFRYEKQTQSTLDGLHEQLSNKQENIKEKQVEISGLQTKISELTSANYRLQSENKCTKDNYLKIKKINEDISGKLFESQLATAFTISMYDNWDKQEKLGIHYLQGSLDKNLADFIGQTNGTFWLLEIKRDDKEIAKELKKDQREKQFKSLTENPTMMTLADRCHWLGWGNQPYTEKLLSFIQYWNIWKEKKLPVQSSFDLDSFVKRAYANSENKEVPIGISPDDFGKYTTFLMKSAGDTTNSNFEDTPAFLFYKDKDGRTSMELIELFSYCKQISLILTKQAVKDIVKEQKRNKGMSWHL